MLTQIQPFDDFDCFPPLDKAAEEPNGLLAIGGDLQAGRLLAAYRRGIFPWFNDGQPILWWSPNPRMVMFPHEFHRSRSLLKSIRKNKFEFSLDQAFDQVIQACAEPRDYANETWITEEMKSAYSELHRQGHAHSIEVWQQHRLVGGLYGLAIGGIFFGESMFSKVSDASKAAFMKLSDLLSKAGYKIIDCQVYSDHLASLGARSIDRKEFASMLEKYIDAEHICFPEITVAQADSWTIPVAK